MPPEIVFLTIAGLGFWIAITGIVMGVWSGMSAGVPSMHSKARCSPEA